MYWVSGRKNVHDGRMPKRISLNIYLYISGGGRVKLVGRGLPVQRRAALDRSVASTSTINT